MHKEADEFVPETSLETLAIVKATLGEMDAHHPTIMLSMWHHLVAHPRRDVLLASFSAGDDPQTFMQALLMAARARQHGGWPKLRVPVGMAHDDLPLLEGAFVSALKDVLGRLAAPMVVNAWSEMVRAFLRELTRRSPAP